MGKREKSYTLVPIYVVSLLFVAIGAALLFADHQIEKRVEQRLQNHLFSEVRLLTGGQVEIVFDNGRVERFQGEPHNLRKVSAPLRNGPCYGKNPDICS